jgi:hypothetical protein
MYPAATEVVDVCFQAMNRLALPHVTAAFRQPLHTARTLSSVTLQTQFLLGIAENAISWARFMRAFFCSPQGRRPLDFAACDKGKPLCTSFVIRLPVDAFERLRSYIQQALCRTRSR